MSHTGTVKEKYEKHGRKLDAECYELVRRRGPALTADEYQQQAMRSLNPALSKHDVLINGVMGLCGESGEAIDIVKKHLHQGHDLDREKLIKELGDIAWYLAETAFALDVSLERVLRSNLEKLQARYPEGFDTEKSINR
ncbi:MAG: nucleoside triphosphate pyrophosphohydrolase family protein [Oscillospiraceae bacterium]|nr:nucleoside triphosphate pyrophosphohydrolase family protein [Oscillospiraceae bacterium]